MSDLWQMRNGYALYTAEGLDAITRLLADGDDGLRNELRGRLAIGLHRNVEVTDVRKGSRCLSRRRSARRSRSRMASGPSTAWEAFARLVLKGAYEATLLAAVEQSFAGGSNIVLLTRVGGGAFGNADEWIDDAIVRALAIVDHAGLDIRLVSHGRMHHSIRAIAERFSGCDRAVAA